MKKIIENFSFVLLISAALTIGTALGVKSKPAEKLVPPVVDTTQSITIKS